MEGSTAQAMWNALSAWGAGWQARRVPQLRADPDDVAGTNTAGEVVGCVDDADSGDDTGVDAAPLRMALPIPLISRRYRTRHRSRV